MRQSAARHRLGGFAPAVLLAAAVLAITGCSGGDTQKLHAWVATVKARPGPPLKPIPTLTLYQPYAYPDGDLRSPFVAVAPAKISNVHPNLERMKEYLERYPLDALKYVGSITFGGTTYALVRDPEGVVHRISAGHYLGQNNGRIIAVLADKIKLTEIVPDGTGGYQRRSASLALAEQSGG